MFMKMKALHSSC